MRADTVVMPILQQLLDCLKEELEASELDGDLCFIGLTPGAEVAYDYGCGGQVWIKLNNAFPSAVFPTPFDPSQGPNIGVGIAFQIEMGIIRAAPGIEEGGELPTVEEMLTSVELQMADMSAMRRALACCLGRSDWQNGRDLIYAITDYLPTGPEGGVVGGSWNFVAMWE